MDVEIERDTQVNTVEIDKTNINDVELVESHYKTIKRIKNKNLTLTPVQQMVGILKESAVIRKHKFEGKRVHPEASTTGLLQNMEKTCSL